MQGVSLEGGTLARCARVLADGGIMAFTIKRADPDTADNIQLRETGRYVQRPEWIRELAQNNGLSVVYEEPVELRRQAGQTLGGALIVLRA